MKIEWVQQCTACKGTGLYVGIGERDGAAVVCHQCKGTGRREMSVEYEEFTGRKPRQDVKRVFRSGCGIVLHPIETPGGVSYQEWEDNPDSVHDLGNELRDHTCPKWYYQGGPHSGREVDWEKCREGCGVGGRFSECLYFSDKANCWKKFDEENKSAT